MTPFSSGFTFALEGCCLGVPFFGLEFDPPLIPLAGLEMEGLFGLKKSRTVLGALQVGLIIVCCIGEYRFASNVRAMCLTEKLVKCKTGQTRLSKQALPFANLHRSPETGIQAESASHRSSKAASRNIVKVTSEASIVLIQFWAEPFGCEAGRTDLKALARHFC